MKIMKDNWQGWENIILLWKDKANFPDKQYRPWYIEVSARNIERTACDSWHCLCWLMNKKLDDIWTAINKASRNRKIIHHYSFYELALKQSKTLQLLILLQSIRSHPSTSPPSKGQVTRFVLSFVIHTHLLCYLILLTCLLNFSFCISFVFSILIHYIHIHSQQ